MTKQEEIREGMRQVIKDHLLAGAISTNVEEALCQYLYSQLPSIFDGKQNVMSALEYKKKLEDYIAVEPLIEAPTIEI